MKANKFFKIFLALVLSCSVMFSFTACDSDATYDNFTYKLSVYDDLGYSTVKYNFEVTCNGREVNWVEFKIKYYGANGKLIETKDYKKAVVVDEKGQTVDINNSENIYAIIKSAKIVDVNYIYAKVNIFAIFLCLIAASGIAAFVILLVSDKKERKKKAGAKK